MPLERIKLTNFQRHAKLRVNPGKQITAVVGPSDVGKSSLCRAIRWLAINKPRGSGFIRRGEKSCSVKIRIDGIDIERIKDFKGNRYILDGKEYKAIGNDIPPDVAKVLAMGPENFQQQHDGPFWFDLTPGELGKELNKIVDMEIIDKALAEIASRLRQGRSTEDVCEQRLVQAETQVTELKWVPGFVDELAEVIELKYKADAADVSLSDLKESLAGVKECKRSIERDGRYVEAGRVVIELYETSAVAVSDLSGLKGLLADVTESVEVIERNSGYIEAGRVVLEQGDVYKSAKQEWSKLQGLLEDVAENQQEVKDFGYNRDESRKLLKQESKGMCPICGGKM